MPNCTTYVLTARAQPMCSGQPNHPENLSRVHLTLDHPGSSRLLATVRLSLRNLAGSLLTDQVGEDTNDLLGLRGTLLGDAASRLINGSLVVAEASLVSSRATRLPEATLKACIKSIYTL